MEFKVGILVRPNLDKISNRFTIRYIKTVKVSSVHSYDEDSFTLRFNEDPGFGYFNGFQTSYNSDWFKIANHYGTKLGKILYK